MTADIVNARRINLALWSAAALLAAAVPSALVVGLFARLDAVDEPRAAQAARGRPVDAATGGVPTLDSFGAALSRAFRPSLEKPTAEMLAKAPDASPPPTVAPARLQLVGTVGESVAMIRGPDGTVALVEVGDDVEGADVIAIAPTRVDLRQNGRRIVLQKAPAPTADAVGVTIR